MSKNVITQEEAYHHIRNAGFSWDDAPKMLAIIERESNFDASCFNYTPETGDFSFGLTQVNLHGPSYYVAQMRVLGLQSPEQLFDPATHLRCVAKLCRNGNPALLDALWYIGRPGVAKNRYDGYLPGMISFVNQLDPQVVT